MRGLLALWLAFAFVTAGCAQGSDAPAVPANTSSAVERHGALRVEGNRIVDKNGAPVVLRGMSLFWSQWMPRYYNEDAVRWLRDDWNVNIIRAAVASEPNGYVTRPEQEYAKLERVIDAAISNGIYVIVDWHAHEPRTASALDLFEKVASKYGAYPNIIYETWNEPLPRHDWRTVIKPHHEAITRVIRARDPDNLIVAGTQSWSQDVDKAAADPLSDANTAYALHFYAATHKQELRDRAQAALDRGVALFVTEWGTTLANGDDRIDLTETRRWWDFMEKNQLSYLNWSIADKREMSAALKPGASGKGGWADDEITESGHIVRSRLRAMNPRPETAKW